MAEIVLTGSVSKNSPTVQVTLEHVTQAEYEELCEVVCREVQKKRGVSGIASAFLTAMRRVPAANPSDVWLYIIYYTYINRGCGNEQSWKRSSGAALEYVLELHYTPILVNFGLRWTRLTEARARRLVEEFGLTISEVAPKKLDAAIETLRGEVRAVMHCKSSLAERISDDAPASRRLIERGCPCAIVTMDMKHFPPPHGDGVNYGELGGRRQSRGALPRDTQQKRGYVEEEGDFSALFSYNLRTPATVGDTRSGSRIYTLSFSDKQPDALVTWARGLPTGARATGA